MAGLAHQEMQGGKHDDCATRSTVVEFASPSFRDLFVKNYPAIRELCGEMQALGVVVVAVDSRRETVAGSVVIEAKLRGLNAAIIGRHSALSDWGLFLEEEPSLSLRHIALVVEPVAHTLEVQFRLLDLRSSCQRGFVDEEGRSLCALTAQGPAFVWCGRYVLFCFTSSVIEGWGSDDSAESVWEYVPGRVHLKEETTGGDRRKNGGSQPQLESSGYPSSATRREPMRGPHRTLERLLAPDEEPLGVLHISSEQGTQRLVVGPRAADRGVVIGRAERCDGSTTADVLSDERISRVHLLVLRVGKELYAIDAGSSNGTWIRHRSATAEESRLAHGSGPLPAPGEGEWEQVRVVPLVDGTELYLAQEAIVRFEWQRGG